VPTVTWCWRCRADIPMLDEAEWSSIAEHLRAAGALGPNRRITPSERDKRFAPVLQAYERITGMAETNINAIWHHRRSLYGPPCAVCGKPLRTPRASFCAACGWQRLTA
jgi:hypothetical protein